jgi:LmbE family N-acetylglucosaminyl deacetylase
VKDDVASLGSILGIWAHPDDEAYLMGGVMALAADAGQRVACVTATLGDAGDTADAERWPQHELRAIRRAELVAAMDILGVQDHECLDLDDGTLASLDATPHVTRLSATIDRIRPDSVITFGPDGMTGHPDHQAVCAWTGAAVARSGHGARLLHATKTLAWADEFADVNGEVFPPGLPPVAEPIWSLTLDDATLGRKVRALEAHGSQTTGIIAGLGRERYSEWVRLEAFQGAVDPGSPI